MPLAAQAPCPDDPAEGGPIPAHCGVWASASLGDDANDGSPGAPVATLSHAADLAMIGPRRVYACAEVFEQPLEWPAGVALHGGVACDDLDWWYPGSKHTELIGQAGEIPLTLTGSVHAEPSLLTDLKVEAADAVQPGGSSIAVLARTDARAELRRCELRAGDGADGADGDDGDHFGAPAKDGLSGKNGAAACTGPIGKGGETVALDCEGEDASFGGEGGNGGEMAANPGDDGEVAPAVNPQGFGLGGKGEDLAASLFCTPGIGGAVGKDGDPGLGGGGVPRLTATGYLGVWGNDGQRGRAGQGGGGGGGAAGTAAACGAQSAAGAGGGSGGTGGCGGRGGRGGQPGGASIGLAALTSALVLSGVQIEAGNGGRGGRGGVPQQGGQGGLPGIGGAGVPMVGGPNPGCLGGGGGYGGDGGPGGGGLGGFSLALAHVGVPVPELVGFNVLLAGAAGAGGEAGEVGLTSAKGDEGVSGATMVLLP